MGTVAVDWSKVLSLEGLARIAPEVDWSKVDQVHSEPMVDSQGDPALRVTVVFKPEVGLDDFTWDLLRPIHDAIFDAVEAATADGAYLFPHIRWLTAEDFESLRHEPVTEDSEAWLDDLP